MKNPGQVSRFPATRTTPSHQPPGARGVSVRSARPASYGSSRTQSQMQTASTSDAMPAARKTCRHETYSVIHASGTVARMPPTLPISINTPTQVANSRSRYQDAISLSTETNATATPNPTSARPTSSHATFGASAKSTEPQHAPTQPAAKSRHGPTESASTPQGNCITAYG